ncbi:MAG TPA: aquaporin, partial [Solirubrobacteraceae bacterium]|nr:aquaporin [Solirubrobacteraceae bacterium]
MQAAASTTQRPPAAGIEPRGPAAYVAELLGTFLLVLFICMIVSDTAVLGVKDFAVIGLLHAFLLGMLIYTLGATSGGHFNPAVSVALMAIRKIRPVDAVIYIVMQLTGAIAGAYVCKALLLDAGKSVHYGATTVSTALSGNRTVAALVVEALGTFALMWAIMGTAVNPRGNRAWAGFVIGTTLAFAVMTFAPLTGASFNPARSLGPALASATWTDFWIYIVGPLVGATIA